MDELSITAFYVISCILFVIMISIKNKTNVIDNLIDFCIEWKKNAIPGFIFICIIVILCWAWFK